MDTLFHFIFALVGGYVLVKGLGIRYHLSILIFLSISSLLIDLDHLMTYLGVYEGLKLHNLLIVLIPVVLFFIFRDIYFAVFSVMLFGHLIADMIYGIYGVPLFYPFSKATYLIPRQWEIYFSNDPTMPLVSTAGIAILIYLAVISLIVSIPYLLSSTNILRKRSTKI